MKTWDFFFFIFRVYFFLNTYFWRCSNTLKQLVLLLHLLGYFLIRNSFFSFLGSSNQKKYAPSDISPHPIGPNWSIRQTETTVYFVLYVFSSAFCGRQVLLFSPFGHTYDDPFCKINVTFLRLQYLKKKTYLKRNVLLRFPSDIKQTCCRWNFFTK